MSWRKLLEPKTPNQNWVLWGQIFSWFRLGSAWSCLVVGRNDQEKQFLVQIWVKLNSKGCRLLLIERINCGSRGILLATPFFETPRNSPGNGDNNNTYIWDKSGLIMKIISISDLHNLRHLLLVDYSIAVNIVHPAKETVRNKKWKMDDIFFYSLVF